MICNRKYKYSRPQKISLQKLKLKKKSLQILLRKIKLWTTSEFIIDRCPEIIENSDKPVIRIKTTY